MTDQTIPPAGDNIMGLPRWVVYLVVGAGVGGGGGTVGSLGFGADHGPQIKALEARIEKLEARNPPLHPPPRPQPLVTSAPPATRPPAPTVQPTLKPRPK